MLYNMIIYDYPLSLLKFFQKPHGGRWTVVRRLIHFSSFCASAMNRLADDELLPGDACQFGTIIVFLLWFKVVLLRKKWS